MVVPYEFQEVLEYGLRTNGTFVLILYGLRDPNYKKQTDDRAQAMAVVSGLASPDKYPALFETLKKEYHASPYMEKYALEALFKMGHADFAIERMKSRYAKMLKYDYTTTPGVEVRLRS